MFIRPDWPAPYQVNAHMTLRGEGYSLSPYDYFNLATHVGDDPAHVKLNREKLANDLSLPTEPLWLDQQHTTVVVSADRSYSEIPVADASYSVLPDHVCAVMTADCIPLLICDQQGTQVAAIHAGWRGLADGVIAATLEKLSAKRSDLLVWLGAAIGREAFEVGVEVIEAFTSQSSGLEEHFVVKTEGKFLGDLYAIARYQLSALGVHHVYGGNRCTYSEPTYFYSYRRDGTTGRMASLIWLSQ